MRYKKEKHFSFKALFFIALVVFFLILVASNITNTSFKLASNNNNEPAIVEEPKQPDISISMAVIGDIMCHGPNYQDAYNAKTKEYDFSTFFTQVKPYVSEADIAIGNLETTFAGGKRAYSGYPTFNSPVQLAKDIKDMGIDVLTTSNNHSLDTGYNGLINTIDELDNLEIAHTGTFKSQEDKDTILVKEINGIKIAFLSYTYGTNGIPVPKGKEYCINLIDKDLIKQHLDKAKELNPDVICVSMHWGIEYKIKQNTEQEDLADFLFENGADIVLGSHPHVLEPMEKRTIKNEDGTTKDGFVIYSLGNFCSAQKDKYTKDSIVLNLKLTKHSDGKVSIDSYDYTPIYMQDSGAGAKDRYQIIDLNKKIKEYESGNSDITKAQYNTYVSELKNITNILGEPQSEANSKTDQDQKEDTKKVSSSFLYIRLL
ncbi:MAG: CapA family protein [Clostridia bacterium]|nr:CapA family protein [Clostridia bacterium]